MREADGHNRHRPLAIACTSVSTGVCVCKHTNPCAVRGEEPYNFFLRRNQSDDSGLRGSRRIVNPPGGRSNITSLS
ncbi:hypothetical protein AB205_0134930 [Aquarana catesbeiana]|uniref:Uncharacterized protein n=1 Tax=Aquarana catesbeiana TaxID=8400 RepID=A0A2G9S871_AQUCT|nr:hypothetical protein AB205_0134930 [Aquarana catesbeiana]